MNFDDSTQLLCHIRDPEETPNEYEADLLMQFLLALEITASIKCRFSIAKGKYMISNAKNSFTEWLSSSMLHILFGQMGFWSENITKLTKQVNKAIKNRDWFV